MSSKFISPEKPPEGIERELLTILIEECAEVQQRATKALRFGLLELQELDNIERLSLEIEDLDTVINYINGHGMLHKESFDAGGINKIRQLEKYLQYE